MEQLVLVPVSMNNNKRLNTQVVTNQELPEYQAEQNSTYQTDSVEKKMNKMFCRSSFLVDKNFPCPRINLPSSQTLILDSV